MAASERVRVLLVDDSIDFRVSLGLLLAATCDVVGTIDDGEGIENAVARLCPDVVVLDVSMPRVNGFDAAQQLLAVCPDAKIIFLTSHTDPAYQHRAYRIGARGFVLKARAATDLLPAIRVVNGNGTFFSEGG